MESQLDKYIEAANIEDHIVIKTCWDCSQRIGEECGIDGHEVYPDSEACGAFEEY